MTFYSFPKCPMSAGAAAKSGCFAQQVSQAVFQQSEDILRDTEVGKDRL